MKVQSVTTTTRGLTVKWEDGRTQFVSFERMRTWADRREDRAFPLGQSYRRAR